MTRIRLDELPGFDPVGLWVVAHSYGRESRGLCLPLRHGKYDVLTTDGAHELDPTPTLREEVYVDAADPATADRLARYIAERTGAGAGMTAPTFGWHYDSTNGGRWQLGNVPLPVAFACEPPPVPQARTWGRHWHVISDMPEPVDIDALEYEERVKQSTLLAFAYVARWVGRPR